MPHTTAKRGPRPTLLSEQNRTLIGSNMKSNISDDLEYFSMTFTYCKPYQMRFSYNCTIVGNISNDRASRGFSTHKVELSVRVPESQKLKMVG